MLYLSFDIGIKNLAYILLECNEENTKNIKEWGIINIMEEDINKQEKCSICKSYAEYCNKKDLTNFFCKKHYKKYLESGEKKLNKLKIINCNKVDTFTVINKMYDLFESKYKYFLDSDIVLLEMQPVKRQQMRTIANMIHSYFNISGVRNNNSNIKNVFFTSATNKLKYNVEETQKTKNTYSERKKLAIKYCNDYLNNIENKYYLDFFNNSQKKDDLADALLQCIFFINN